MDETLGYGRSPRSLIPILIVSVVILAVAAICAILLLLRPWEIVSPLSSKQLAANPDGSMIYPGSELISSEGYDGGSTSLDGSLMPARFERDLRTDASVATVINWYSPILRARGWRLQGADPSSGAVLFTQSDLDLIVESYSGTPSYLPGATGYGVTHPATYSIVISQAPAGCSAFPPPSMLGISVPGMGVSKC